MKEKILTTPRSYGKNMPQLFTQLEEAGYEVVKNTTGGILEKEAMKELIADCVGIIVGVDPLDAEVLACAPKLRAIAKYGVGVDNLSLPEKVKVGGATVFVLNVENMEKI